MPSALLPNSVGRFYIVSVAMVIIKNSKHPHSTPTIIVGNVGY